jgi:hypothetical protein
VKAKIIESNLNSLSMDDIADETEECGDVEMFDGRLLGCFFGVLVHLVGTTVFIQRVAPAGTFKNLLYVFSVDVVLTVSVTDSAFEGL